MRARDTYRFAVRTDQNVITPALRRKVLALREYGLTLKQIAIRFSIAESTAHKIFHAK